MFVLSSVIYAQSEAESEATLRVNSRAVLVDVVITGKDGKPVQGLPRNAFSITEDNAPQSIQFFEEHKADARPRQVEMPKLPENTFSNFSPFPEPAAVNVLLLDSLNTTMADQSYVHAQAVKFLKSAKPGDRMAIFTMDLGLHFIQGFNDDPSVLAAALEYKKNNWVGNSVMLQSQSELNAQSALASSMVNANASADMVAAMTTFLNENAGSQNVDRIWITLTNLQKLSTFLEGFPGRKNIIWFAEKVPTIFASGGTLGGPSIATADASLEKAIRKTMAMLSAARVALYPVQPSGVATYSLYSAETNMAHSATNASQLLGGFANATVTEALTRNADQFSAQILAEQSGGRAFANTNALAKVMQGVVFDSADFYTLSYAPANTNMDGGYRKIHVNVQGDYHLSYRRGYYALDESLPGSSLATRDAELRKLAEKSAGKVDPLLPFMSLGMPQSEQVLYKAKVQQMPRGNTPADPDRDKARYSIDFAIDRNDLKFTTGADGLHNDQLNISIIAYDRYGNIIARRDHRVLLNAKPDVWQVYGEAGVQLHGEIAVPQNGNYWLRAGIYDDATHKVGTLEIPLSAVKPMQAAQATPRD
jgi:VWFA-related protein